MVLVHYEGNKNAMRVGVSVEVMTMMTVMP